MLAQQFLMTQTIRALCIGITYLYILYLFMQMLGFFFQSDVFILFMACKSVIFIRFQ